MSPYNVAHTSGTNFGVTLSGLNFGVSIQDGYAANHYNDLDTSPDVFIGESLCLTTAWYSNTYISCNPEISSEFGPQTVIFNQWWGTSGNLTSAFTFDGAPSSARALGPAHCRHCAPVLGSA